MNSLKELHKEDKLHFMRVIYSLIMSDDQVSSDEEKTLQALGKTFALKPEDEAMYKYILYPYMNQIADEINAISDIYTRGLLMLIVWDIFKKNNKKWLRAYMGDTELKYFKQLFDYVKPNLHDKHKNQIQGLLK